MTEPNDDRDAQTGSDNNDDVSNPKKGHKKAGTGGRWSLRQATARVENMRQERGVEVNEIAKALTMSRFSWNKKVRLKDNSFSVEEFGQIADFFGAPLDSTWPLRDIPIEDFTFPPAGAGRAAHKAAPEAAPSGWEPALDGPTEPAGVGFPPADTQAALSEAIVRLAQMGDLTALQLVLRIKESK